MVTVHASCVDLGGAAVLIRGPSGSGKSDLALRLIDTGGMLVADDQVALERRDGVLAARAPEPLRGRIEVRGVGIVSAPSVPVARVSMIVDLADPAAIERLPEPSFDTLEGHRLPVVRIAPFEASAPAKVRFALAAALAEELGFA